MPLHTMRHLEFDWCGFRYCLTGQCITVYTEDGEKLFHRFFKTQLDAKKAFLGIL